MGGERRRVEDEDGVKGGKERERSAGEREARRVARLAAATRRTMRSSLRPRASAPHWPWPPSGPLVGRVRRGRAARQPSPDLRNRTNSSHIVLILARKKKKKDQKKHRKKNHEKKTTKKEQEKREPDTRRTSTQNDIPQITRLSNTRSHPPMSWIPVLTLSGAYARSLSPRRSQSSSAVLRSSARYTIQCICAQGHTTEYVHVHGRHIPFFLNRYINSNTSIITASSPVSAHDILTRPLSKSSNPARTSDEDRQGPDDQTYVHVISNLRRDAPPPDSGTPVSISGPKVLNKKNSI